MEMTTEDLGVAVLTAVTTPGNAVVVVAVAEAVAAISREVMALPLTPIRMIVIRVGMTDLGEVVEEVIVATVATGVATAVLVMVVTVMVPAMVTVEATMMAVKVAVDAAADVAVAAVKAAVVGVMAKAFMMETSEAGPWSRE